MYVCMCVYVCMYICVCVCMPVSACVYAYMCVCALLFTLLYITIYNHFRHFKRWWNQSFEDLMSRCWKCSINYYFKLKTISFTIYFLFVFVLFFFVLTVLMTINITSYQHILGQFRFIAKWLTFPDVVIRHGHWSWRSTAQRYSGLVLTKPRLTWSAALHLSGSNEAETVWFKVPL